MALGSAAVLLAAAAAAASPRAAGGGRALRAASGPHGAWPRSPGPRTSPAMSSSPARRLPLRVTTFNLLNPIFHRIDQDGVRESTDEARWLRRNEAIAHRLAATGSDVIALQEYWHGGPTNFRALFETWLCADGSFTPHLCPRPGRGDGCLTLLGPRVSVVGDQEVVHFGDFADRVAQVLHLRVGDSPEGLGVGDGVGGPPVAVELLLVNTHLTYPHAPFFSALRLDEVRRITRALERVKADRRLPDTLPVVLCGDFNGSPTGNVFNAMLAHGFVSAVDQHRGGYQYARKPAPPKLVAMEMLAACETAAVQCDTDMVDELLEATDDPPPVESEGYRGAPHGRAPPGGGGPDGAGIDAAAGGEGGTTVPAPSAAERAQAKAVARAARWVTHRTHTGRCSGVDYVWVTGASPPVLSDALGPLHAEQVAAQCAELSIQCAALDPEESGTVPLDEFLSILVDTVFRSAATEFLLTTRTADQRARERAAYCRLFRERALDLLGLEESMIEPGPPGADAGGGGDLVTARVRYTDYIRSFAKAGRNTRLPNAVHMRPDVVGRDEGMGWVLRAVGSEVYPRALTLGQWPQWYNLSDHGILTCTLEGEYGPLCQPLAGARDGGAAPTEDTAPQQARPEEVAADGDVALRDLPAAMQVPLCHAVSKLVGLAAGALPPEPPTIGDDGGDGLGPGPGTQDPVPSRIADPLGVPPEQAGLAAREEQGEPASPGRKATPTPAGAPPPSASSLDGQRSMFALFRPSESAISLARCALRQVPVALTRLQACQSSWRMSALARLARLRSVEALRMCVDSAGQDDISGGEKPSGAVAPPVGAAGDGAAVGAGAENRAGSGKGGDGGVLRASMPEAAMMDALDPLQPEVTTSQPLRRRRRRRRETGDVDAPAQATSRTRPSKLGKGADKFATDATADAAIDAVQDEDALDGECEPLSDALARLIALDDEDIVKLEAMPEIEVHFSEEEQRLYERSIASLDYFGDWAEPANTRDSIVLSCQVPRVVSGEFTCAEGFFTDERERLHRRIMAHMLPPAGLSFGEPIDGSGPGMSLSPRRAYIVVGVPGSGKDSVIKRYLRRANAGVDLIDASADRLKGYLAMWGEDELCRDVRQHCKQHGYSKQLLHAQYLHRESIFVVTRVVDEAIKRGLPFMCAHACAALAFALPCGQRHVRLEKTLYNVPQIVSQVKNLRASGYEVHLYGTLISPLKNWEFLHRRAQSGQSLGRLISKAQAVQALRRYHANLELILRDPTFGEGARSSLNSINLYDVVSGDWKLRLIVPQQPLLVVNGAGQADLPMGNAAMSAGEVDPTSTVTGDDIDEEDGTQPVPTGSGSRL